MRVTGGGGGGVMNHEFNPLYSFVEIIFSSTDSDESI